jgi:hypothetical protein
VSELPRRTARQSDGQRDVQPAEARAAISDASAPAPTGAGMRTIDAGSVAGLDERDIEAIAARVAALLDRPPHRLVKVDEVAALLAVDPAFVYVHQHELGVLRLPTRGRRGALRFDRGAVLELLRQRAAPRAPRAPKRRSKPTHRRTPAGVELLPYEPRSAA